MGDKATDSIVIEAPGDDILAVILKLEDYPEWSDDIKATEVLSRDDQGRPLEVLFDVDARVAQVQYTLRYDHSTPDVVEWSLAEAEVLNQLDGSYVLAPDGEARTKVTYSLEVDIAIPVPGFLRKRAAKAILDAGLKGLKRRVEQG